MASKMTWADLSPTQRKAVVAAAAAELVLTTWALRDLWTRPAERVRGPKALWGASLVVQPFGPVGYLAFGRR
jgi:hypothetical protein